MTRPSSVSALCVSEGQSPESAGPPFPCLCPCTSGSVITRMTTLTLWPRVTSAPSQEAEFGLSWCSHRVIGGAKQCQPRHRVTTFTFSH